MRSVACPVVFSGLCLLTVLANPVFAEPRWIKARLGPFEAISDDGRRPATQALSQFAQFSFALGTVMGKPDLRLETPLRIIVFKNAQELEAHCNPALRTGRDRFMACTTSEGQLPPGLLRDLTRMLLESNFANLPAPIETALETFFSTVESSAVHVTWGAAPPQREQTREWALLHRIITQPDYSGKARIYLHNLAAGMDKNAASRNAFAQEGPKFDAEVDQYYAAGDFKTSAAPNRPLNPDRDFNTTALTSDEGDLMRADLLNAASVSLYQGLLKGGKHPAEANEGLALLAMRNNDSAGARSYMEAARRAGTKNFVALTEYAKSEPDEEKAIQLLKEALTADAKYAPAHWAFGEKLADPERRLAEWKQAVNLAPRRYDWWAQYAQLCTAQKQYAEAGRAWVSAAQAAPNVQLREQYLTARGQIDQLRLEAEDVERRREALEKAREMDRLKADARKELADLEARVNTRPLSAREAAKTVEWFGDTDTLSINGTLTRVDCTGRQLRLSLKDDEGRNWVLLVPDTEQFEIKGGETVACGAQKGQPRVRVAYKPATPAKTLSGEAVALEFRR